MGQVSQVGGHSQAVLGQRAMGHPDTTTLVSHSRLFGPDHSKSLSVQWVIQIPRL